MQIPSLKQLERALHIRGMIESLQSELASLFTNLGDAIAPKPPKHHRSKSKPPFADEVGGAKSKRLAERSKARTVKRKGKNRKTKAAAAKKARIRSIVTGGEMGAAPVATEPKNRRKQTGRPKAKKGKKRRS